MATSYGGRATNAMRSVNDAADRASQNALSIGDSLTDMLASNDNNNYIGVMRNPQTGKVM